MMVRRRLGGLVLGLAVACSDDGMAGLDTDASSEGATGLSAGTDGSGASTTGDTSDPSASGQGTSTTGGGDTDDGTTDDPGPTSAPGCEPLGAPEGDTVVIGPSDSLEDAIADAATGTTILLEDGMYDVSGAGFIVFRTPGVTLRSQSGNADAVVLDGGYGIGSVLNVAADDVTIAEITIQRCMWHPIHVTGGEDSNTDNTTIYGVRIIDPGQQAIKINASAQDFYADDGTIACSSVVMTDQGRGNVDNCYTGGVDAHLARGWTVRDNYFEGFWCDQGLSEHAVHFWNSARDTIVERNTIIDCARGVGFGLGATGNGTSRDYGDDACPGASFVGHYGGVIRNNVIVGADPAMFGSEFGMDSGVALEQACGSAAVHNTIVSLMPPFTSIEYRWADTDAIIHNNLVTHSITMRDDGVADLQGNMTDAVVGQFVDADALDLHLVAGADAIDAGVPLAAGLADEDIDGDPRDASPDAGADEFTP